MFARAIDGRKQVVCTYQDHSREICPIIVGHTKGVEKTLVI
jgi:hypothetical protein